MLRFSKLMLAALVALPLTIGGWAAKATSADLLETAAAAGAFGTLIEAVKAAGLADTLKGEGPFTIFAPTDEAFAALPAGKLDALLQPENKAALVRILSYHVVPGKVTSSDIAGKMISIKTLEGGELEINSAGRSTKVESAALLTPDVMASNGVIHVVDKVIVPDDASTN